VGLHTRRCQRLLLVAVVSALASPVSAQFQQQGSKLIGTGGGGFAVALSADGNTAIIGEPNDNNCAGAVWVYTRTGGVWTQQGGKLVVPDPVGCFGVSVAISADGNTAIVGAPNDSGGAGAA
jgi:hypothetical protein